MMDATTAVQFATPIAVIIAAIYQQFTANQIKEKVDEVHVLTNDRMSKMMAEVSDLKEKLAQNQISSMDDRLKRIEDSSNASATAATKAVTILGSK